MAATPSKPRSPRQLAVQNAVMRAMSAANTWVFRATGGRLGGRFGPNAPILLLTTTGRRSGKERTTPLLYLRDGGDIVIVASKGGSADHPLWYGNLVANSDVKVQIGRDVSPMRARTADETERERLWPRLVAMYKGYDQYQARTDRRIPVVILSSR
jgi:deazaflavin-dependent oxidoreductase (nitroreductase family)